MATWTDVARILQRLAHTEREEGARTWRVGGKPLAWERPLRRSDLVALGAAAPDCPILAVHVPLEVKDTLLEDDNRVRVVLNEPHLGKIGEPTARVHAAARCATGVAEPR